MWIPKFCPRRAKSSDRAREVKTLLTVSYNEGTGQIVLHSPIENFSWIEKLRYDFAAHLAALAESTAAGDYPVPRGAECIHIVPLNDAIQHSAGQTECQCGPSVDWKRMWVIHHALDGRDPFKGTEHDRTTWAALKGRM